MGRSPCCSKVGLHRGPWSQREDALLVRYIEAHGEGQWRSLPKKAGLLRCGKSCRLRWMNYLRPDIKRGNITPDEEDLIMRLHSLLGNRWSLIAGRLPGRTDNEIKNYWNTHLIKRFKNKRGTDEINTKRKNSKRVHYATKKKKRESGISESERIKVHLPKAIKVTRLSLPRINSFESNITNSASIGSTVDGQPYGCGLLTDDDHDQGGGLIIDGNDNVSPIISQQSAILEEMYEEYLQLIQDDAMSHDDKSNNGKCYLDDMVQEVEAELDVLAETLLV